MAQGSVLITGASSGIGEAMAEVVASSGFDLVLVARREQQLRRTAEAAAASGVDAEILVADLLDERDLRRVEERLRSRTQPIDELVNNAGITSYGNLSDSLVEDSVRQVDLHVNTPLRLIHAALPGMLARGSGGILNVASTAGLQATPGLAAYAASKAALICLSESLHDEVRGRGVRVGCVCPGYTRTELQAVAGVDASQLPSAAWMEPDVVARIAWRGHQRGKALIVPGALNRLISIGLRLAPRTAARRASAAAVRRVRPLGS